MSVVSGGGFAGLVTTTSLDSAALSPGDAAALRAKVDAAGLLDPPATHPGGEPDARSFLITVEDDGRRGAAAFGDRDLPPAVRSLISWIDAQPAREQSIDPPG